MGVIVLVHTVFVTTPGWQTGPSILCLLDSMSTTTTKVSKSWVSRYLLLCTSLSLVENLGHLTWVRRSSHKTSTTHSYQFVEVFRLSEQWYGCQCLRFLTRAQMLMHVISQRGCADTVRESAQKLTLGKKSLAAPGYLTTLYIVWIARKQHCLWSDMFGEVMGELFATFCLSVIFYQLSQWQVPSLQVHVLSNELQGKNIAYFPFLPGCCLTILGAISVVVVFVGGFPVVLHARLWATASLRMKDWQAVLKCREPC